MIEREASSFDALVPSEEQGGSLLVVGNTAADRSIWLTRTLDQIVANASAKPLVIRVSAPTDGDPIELDDAISRAAETALVQHRAPGALYDERACGPLASLSGWLFRARSVGLRGLILVLEEIDRWVDVRGSGTTDSAAANAILRAIDESARRPLSVICGVRAADAGGSAALPNELIARFATLEKLGGATTVSRDPVRLVAALAGRSFSVAGLRNALAGWLDVPDASDDTVVVFSESAPPVQEHEAVEWLPKPTEVSRVVATPTDAVQERVLGAGWNDAVRAALEVRESVRALSRMDGHRGFRQIEKAFARHIGNLPMALAALGEGERALGLERTRISVAGQAALDQFEADFAAYFANSFPAWISGSTRPTMLCDLPARIAHVAAERGARGTALILITGLRFDLWTRLRDRVVPRVPGLMLLEEGLHWAARPTKPSVQRELVARGLNALAADLPRRDEPTAPRSLVEALRPRREHLGRTEVLRIDAYVSALANTEQPLATAVLPIEQALPSVLLSLCGGFPGRTVLAMAGDVGLREVSTRIDGTERARFQYGGDSPFEAIVPYALFTWG